ncbi:TRAP-type mannitol/chloroaromatic compound transport system, small permease component [Variovorax sp. OK605]|jgi:TRAP-type mannitol/chloroaromatic compound transport system permease small subunit|uniref:TRAP transporter small permease subunit n=1 Tax=unclassified Variovorax TaxID=663243 RepID=UPI0008BBAD2A|nr:MULTISPECIES: TRAP transporter small permease subunit [unclassified Variovorax]SEJ23379.1 TRAP-type mannitol/chloroaromatic compound transport system, small permease component [Variovorax sp. OK202]SFC15220.1 TRAP-type mannitol/chloroaromatic compound transport system, small permease component [Variovorax sp. OK212]SFO74951.1 TRAP-type mannitol/chloroaromatic compound transport system, small permease component [Variovorax sp. OK605]
MQGLLKLSRAIDWLNAQVGRYAIWLILAATAISALNAIVRKVFNTSSNAFLEVQWYLFAWSFLIAAGFTLLHREHVRIDVLNSRLSKRKQVWIDIIGFTFFLTPLCITVLWLSMPVVIQMYQSGEMSGNSGGLIRWPVWAALPVGFVLLLLQGWSELIKRIAFLRGEGPDPMGRLTDKTAEAELIEALRLQAEADAAKAAPGTSPVAAKPQH